MSEDREERAKLVCLRLLNYRARSRAELKTRLADKGFSAEIIRRVLADLSRLGLVNDEAFAQQWVAERMRRHPRGAAVLRQELRKRGISPQLAEATVAQALGEGGELAAAVTLAQGRWRRLTGGTVEQRQARLGRFLAGRGFSYSIIRKALRICVSEESDGA